MSDPISEADQARQRAINLNAAMATKTPPGSIPPVIPMLRRHGPPPIPASASLPPPLPGFIRRRPLLSSEELERFGDLLLFARCTVEGFFAGKHRSPFRGSSVEFTDYKEYITGDDPKRIDWRAYGRSRRLFVRQYEAETEMVIYLLVDVSASMSYAGPDHETKYVLAARVAAALAYLMIRQGDKAALGLFSSTLTRFVSPGGTRAHLHKLISELEVVVPALTTGIAQALADCNPLFKRRGLLVVLSDFWDDPDQMFEALSRFLHRKFEILLLQIAHPDEIELPAINAARFHDMETHEEVVADPDEIRAVYQELSRRRTDMLAREADHRRISYALVRTNRPYLDAIEAYLGFRGRNTLSTR
jgi:uncharacterized protein (DUF58 family)